MSTTVATLLDAPFQVLVEDDAMRPEAVDPELAAELRAPENAARWRRALIQKKVKLQSSLRSSRLNMQKYGYTPEDRERRNRTAFALGRIEIRLIEATAGAKANRNRAFETRTLLDRAQALLLELAPEDARVRRWIDDRDA